MSDSNEGQWQLDDDAPSYAEVDHIADCPGAINCYYECAPGCPADPRTEESSCE